ncbi:MAG: serine/threonine-protein kinase, partial [Gemmataceae bacterium]
MSAGSIEQTPVMQGEELDRARSLSKRKLRPPARVPGYDDEEFLGKGAFGEVWKAVSRNTGRLVAIKFYNQRGGLDWSLLSREVEKLRFLFNSRHVIQLLEVGWNAEPPYYVMEFLSQGSLEDRLHEGPLPVHEALEVFREVLVGLSHAHGKGVLHCDLKPANVLLDQDGKPRLADFGQSRLTHEHSPALGTLFYMAPEQAHLNANPDVRWDVYALGALLYRMITGHPPFRSEEGVTEISTAANLEDRLERYRKLLRSSPPPVSHRRVAGVDKSLADIIERCLSIDPKNRFPNVEAVLNALEQRAQRRARRPVLVFGAVGPILGLVLVSLFAYLAFESAVDRSRVALVASTQESNRFAAQFVASTISRQINQRFDVLDDAAQSREARNLLEAADGKDGTSIERRELQLWLDSLRDRYEALLGTQQEIWFINDAR